MMMLMTNNNNDDGAQVKLNFVITNTFAIMRQIVDIKNDHSKFRKNDNSRKKDYRENKKVKQTINCIFSC